MGWAKYNEDDTEIYYERMVQRESIDKIKTYDFTYSSIVLSATKNVNCTEKKSATHKDTFKNRKIICKDCGKEFIFTEKQQKQFKELGFKDPKRCKHCREIRKKQLTNSN